MSDRDDLSAEEEFAVLINKEMAKGIQDGADPDQMARVCLNYRRRTLRPLRRWRGPFDLP